MMKVTQQHVEALKRFKPTMDAFTAVNALIDDQTTLDSLQQAHTEAESRLAEKLEKEKGIDTRLEACAAQEARADRIHELAVAGADQIRNIATLEADKIKDEAAKTAESILDRVKADALRMRDAGKADLQDIEKLVEGKRTEFTELADAADKKRAELDTLNADLEAAKEHIAVLLRGKV